MFFTNVTIMPPEQCSQSLVQCYSPYRAEDKKPKTFEHSRRKRIRLAKDFSYRVKTGNFIYLQEQLCAIARIKENYMREHNLPLKRETGNLHTPFGEVEFELRPCPVAHRYTVFIKGAGTYKDITRSLDEKFTDPKTRKEIYDTILKYLRSAPTNTAKGWGNQEVYTSTIKDIKLAQLCAILAMCDPCFGEGENGGKDIRAVLERASKGAIPSLLTKNKTKSNTSTENQTEREPWTFANLADSRYNPFCIKGAYRLLRRSVKKNNPRYRILANKDAAVALSETQMCHSKRKSVPTSRLGKLSNGTTIPKLEL